jgi:hypothetical protein
MTILEPHLSDCSSFLVPSTEFSIEGMALLDATAVIKNATEELKRLSQNGVFTTPLQSLAEMCVAQESYI